MFKRIAILAHRTPNRAVTSSDDRTSIAPTARVAAGALVQDQAVIGGSTVALGEVTVADWAQLVEHGMLGGTARLQGRAVLSGWAAVIEQAVIDGDAWVFGRAVVSGHASIAGHAQVFGDATVTGGAVVDGNAWIHGHALVTGDAWVSGRAQVGAHAIVCGTATVAGALRAGGHTVLGDGADITRPGDFETHRLSWGEHVTLYRCDDGVVGLGRSETVHGPVTADRTHLLDGRLTARIAELGELWAPARPDPISAS